MNNKTGYVYLLRATDQEGNILTKYGCSKYFPKERRDYWIKQLKEDLEFSLIVKCRNYKKLENKIKWFIADENNWFIIKNHYELGVNIEEQVKDFIKSSSWLEEIIYEK